MPGSKQLGEEHRVELVPWDGHKHGAEHLGRTLDELSKGGWSVVTVVPTRAGASAKSILAASGSADTTELAVILRRAR